MSDDERSNETIVDWRSFFRNWVIADLALGFLVLIVAKSKGADFYLLSFISVFFLAALPLALTVGIYSVGVTKVASGDTSDGKKLKVVGLVLSISVFVFFINASVH